MLKKFDIKYFILFIAIAAVAMVVYVFNTVIVKNIEFFISNSWLQIVIGTLSVSATLLAKIRHRKLTFRQNMTFSQFRVPFEELWSFVSNPISLVCSLSLTKGLFLQFRGKQNYFVGFSNTELFFISVVVAYLLFDGFMEFISNCKLALLHTSTVTAVAESIHEE